MTFRRLLVGVLLLLVVAEITPSIAADGAAAPLPPPTAGDNAARANDNTTPTNDNSCPAVDNSILAPPPVCPDNNWIDRTHTFLTRNTLSTVQHFDDFFGDKYREEVAPAESTVRWRNNFRFGSDKTFTFRTDLRANIRLHKMSKRLRLVFSTETFEDALGIKGDETTAQQGVAPAGAFHSSSTELRYEMTKTARTEADIGVGARIKLPLVTYLRARYRFSCKLFDNNVLVRFQPTAFWRTHDGLGQSTVIDFEHRLGEETILRWANSETMTQITSGMEWNSEPGILHALKSGKASYFAIGMSGATRPAATVNRYYVLTRYRQAIYRDWVFAEVEPVQAWDRGIAGGYHPVSVVNFRFEVLFKGTRKELIAR